jgi:phosphoglycolate phosphatase
LETESILADLYPNGEPPFRAMSGADRLLAALAGAGFPLGLATSDDYGRTMGVLTRLGWLERFVFFSCGDTAAETKPSPWSVREFSRVVGVPCSRIAVVGDTEVDREMATSAGAGLFVLAEGGFPGWS